MNERAGGTVVLPGAKKSARAIEPRLTSRAKAGIRKALFENSDFRQLLVEAGHLKGGSGSAVADAAAQAAESKALEDLKAIVAAGYFDQGQVDLLIKADTSLENILALAQTKMKAEIESAKSVWSWFWINLSKGFE